MWVDHWLFTQGGLQSTVVTPVPTEMASTLQGRGGRAGEWGGGGGTHKLPALVYDILPSATAVFSYAIGSRKTSANEQFFAGAQTVVSLLQTTQIKQGCHL